MANFRGAIFWFGVVFICSCGVKFTVSRTVPLGQDGKFLCQTDKGSKPGWELTYTDETRIFSVPFLSMCDGVCVLDPVRGIKYTYNESAASTMLTIAGTERNNGTQISCIEYTNLSGSEIARQKLLVYGLPSAPTGVIVHHRNISYMSLTWTPGFTPFNVSTFHTVYYVSRRGSSEIVGHNVSTQLLLPVPQQCGSNNYRVYATNQVGQSNLFSETSFSGLIISNLKEVQDSISYSIERHANITELCIFMTKLPRFCPGYEGTRVSISLFTPKTPSQVQMLDISTLPAKVELMNNAVYKFSLFVLNNLIIYEADRDIYTTNVIAVKVSVDDDCQMTRVTCKFHLSSKAKGCVVYVEEDESSVKVHCLERKEDTATTTIDLCKNSITGINIRVLDWLEDGTKGSISLPVEYVDENLTSSSTTSVTKEHTGTLGVNSPGMRTMIVGAILGGIAFLIVVTILTAIMVAFIHYKIKPHRYKNNEVQGMPTTVDRSNTFGTMSCASFSPSPTVPSLTVPHLVTTANSIRTQVSYAPTVSSSQSSTPSPVTYPSLSASLARDASPPTPASTAALHVRFSQIPSGAASLYDVPPSPYNRDAAAASPCNVPTSTSHSNYDVPHSPAISLNRRIHNNQSDSLQDSKYDPNRIGFQYNSYALYDQLPRSNNGSPNPLLRVPTGSPSTNPSSLSATPLPPPLPYRSEHTSLQSVVHAPSPEYVAMASRPEDSRNTISSSFRQQSSSPEDFTTPVPFLPSSNNGKSLLESPAHTFI